MIPYRSNARQSRRSLILILALILALTSTTALAFAQIDYTQWDSNGAYPNDVVNTSYFTSVKYLIDKKVLTGYPDNTFRVADPMTRAEFATAIVKLKNRTSELTANSQLSLFTDLSGYDWAKAYINTASQIGYIKGTGAGTFSPAKNISYAEVITILIRSQGGAASEIESYGTWPDNYIRYATMYNMMGDVTVKDWKAPAARGDVAKLMYRFTAKKTTTTSAVTFDLYGANN